MDFTNWSFSRKLDFLAGNTGEIPPFITKTVFEVMQTNPRKLHKLLLQKKVYIIKVTETLGMKLILGENGPTGLEIIANIDYKEGFDLKLCSERSADITISSSLVSGSLVIFFNKKKYTFPSILKLPQHMMHFKFLPVRMCLVR